MPDCEECNKSYTHIGNHWIYNESHRPELSDEQIDMITGLLMGDATLYTQNKTPYIKVVNSSEQYLRYIDEELGVMSTGVKLDSSASDRAERDRNSGFNSSAKSENYSDLYSLQTRGHPIFGRYKDWYKGNKKKFSDKVSLSETILKHWYCCDGHYRNDRGGQIKISAVNESDNRDELKNMFKSSNFPIYDRIDSSDNKHFSIVWNKDSAKQLIEILGEPIKGYEYKWP